MTTNVADTITAPPPIETPLSVDGNHVAGLEHRLRIYTVLWWCRFKLLSDWFDLLSDLLNDEEKEANIENEDEDEEEYKVRSFYLNYHINIVISIFIIKKRVFLDKICQKKEQTTRVE